MFENAVKLSEKERVYHFANGEKVILTNVVELVTRISGNHRIKTADGKLHIVSPGWLHVEITDNDWTV